MLLFEVKNQKLTRVDAVEPATDSQQYLKAKFTINDADWNGKAKTAFFRLGDVVYKALLNSNNECVVPSEVLIRSESRYARTQGSKIFVSLVGEYSTTRITTNEACVLLNTSGYSDAEEPKNPTESEYQQILTQYANNEAAINEAKAECETARADLVGVKNIFANAIKGNLSGAVVHADDVSPIEHNLKAGVRSKNIIPFPYHQTSGTVNGVTFTINDDGSIKVVGTANGNAVFYLVNGQKLSSLITGEVYTPSILGASNHNVILMCNYKDKNGADQGFTTTQMGTKVYPDDVDTDQIYLLVTNGTKVDTTVYPQLEFGETATKYEPYVDPSTITVRKCGKNFAPCLEEGKKTVSNGVTFTGNASGGINISGVPTGVSTCGLYSGKALLKSGFITISLQGTFGNIVPDFQLSDANGNIVKQVQTGTKTTLNLDNYPEAVNWYIAIKRASNNVACSGSVYVQIETGADSTPFEKYNGTEHTPSADGTVEGITSLSPYMTILTDTEGATVECEYIKDTNKVLQKIADALNITI